MTNEEPTTEAVPTPRRHRKPAGATGDTRPVSRLQSIEERQYHVALEAPDVQAALHDYECAHAKRDSISRKLCGGSTHVTVRDLAQWEASLSEAKKALAQIAKRSPILERHPIFSAVVAHS
ncbi:hypothetical protein [Robbsia andropogonis]|uniref:hypothetical protein n=1 Tax=Robbsia andropogonis TaxID=28092 RepID=UPI000A555F68|nr:hypothetical protein [Robbsia andropogonis]